MKTKQELLSWIVDLTPRFPGKLTVGKKVSPDRHSTAPGFVRAFVCHAPALAVALGLGWLAPVISPAATTTSIRSGPWFDALTWSDGIPGSGDSAVISSYGVGLDATNVDAVIPVANLNFEADGTLTITKGVLQLTGQDSVWSKGGFSGSALLLNGRLTLVSTNAKSAGVLTNEGVILHRDVGSLNLYSAVRLHNAATGLYDLQSDASLIGWPNIFGAPIFVNAGVLRKSAGAGESRLTNLAFQNLGGSVEVLSGTLSLASGGNSTNGTFSAAAGAVLDWAGGTHVWDGRFTVAGDGQMRLSNGEIKAGQGMSLSFPSNVFHWSGGKITGPATNELSITIDGSNGVQLAGTLFNRHHLLHNGSSNLTFVDGAVMDNPPAATYTLAGDGGFDWTKTWPFSPMGSFCNRGLLHKTVGTGVSRFTSVVFNNLDGTVAVDTGTLALASGGASTNGTFSAAAGAVLDLSCPGATHNWNGHFEGAGGGQILLTTGTLASAGTLALSFPSNLFHWNGGKITGPATNELSVTLDGTNGVQLVGTLFNGDQLLHNGSSNLTFVDGAVINNSPVATYTLAGDGGFDWTKTWPFSPMGLFCNQGLLHKTGGNGVSRFTSVVFNNLDGTVAVDTGTLALASGGASTNGTFGVAGGAVLDLSCPGVTHTWNGRYTGTGAGQILLTTGTLASAGTLALSFPSNLFHWNGGQLTGSLTNELSVTLDGTNQVQLNGTFFNWGHLLHSGSSNFNFVGGAILENATGAAYTLAGDGGFDWTYQQWAPKGIFRNQGLLHKAGGTGFSRFTSVAFNNLDGTVAVETGTLALASGGASTNGTFGVAGGAVLDLSCPGVTHTWNGRYTGTGAGQILLTTGTLASAGTLALSFPSNLFHWNGGQLTGPLTNELSVTLDGTNQVQLDGTLFNWGHVLHYGPSNLNLVGGAVLENGPGAVYTLAGDGGLDWTYQQWAPKGIFRNQGLLRKVGGMGDSRFTNVGLQNRGGTVEARSGALCFDYGYTQTDGITSLTGGAIAAPTALDIQGGSVIGSGDILGSLNNGGQLSPGNSIGQINILSNYTQTASGVLRVEIAGRNAGQFDQVNVSGSATLGGALSVTLTNGFQPAPGDIFPVLTYSSRSGSFAATNGLAFNLEYRTNGVFLVATGQVARVTLASPMITGTNFTFSVSTATGKTYTVQATEVPGSGDWADVLTITGDGTVQQVSIPLLAFRERFFRVRVQ